MFLYRISRVGKSSAKGYAGSGVDGRAVRREVVIASAARSSSQRGTGRIGSLVEAQQLAKVIARQRSLG